MRRGGVSVGFASAGVAGDGPSGAGAAPVLVEGTVVAFDGVSYQATVRLDGTASGSVAGVPVSKGLPAAALTAGARILVYARDVIPAYWIVVAVV